MLQIKLFTVNVYWSFLVYLNGILRIFHFNFNVLIYFISILIQIIIRNIIYLSIKLNIFSVIILPNII